MRNIDKRKREHFGYEPICSLFFIVGDDPSHLLRRSSPDGGAFLKDIFTQKVVN